MLKLIVLSLLIISPASVGAESVRHVLYQAESIAPTNSPPTFDNGFLVVYSIGVATVYTRDGVLAYSIPVPDGHHIPYVAVDTDQTAAAAVNRGNSGGGIAIFDRRGSQIQIIETGQYLPSFICFAPDHSIWTTGKHARRSLAEKPEFFILRHFSRDGKELGAFLPRSSFEDDGEPAADIVGRAYLRIANNRIGAFLRNAGNATKALWVEVDLNGKELGRWRTGDIDRQPVAFTPSGAVYAERFGDISVLDHVTGKWNPVPIPSEGILLGADGEALVFMARGTPELRWVPLDTY